MGKLQGWVLRACDEVGGKKRGRHIGDILWWNEDMKEAVPW